MEDMRTTPLSQEVSGGMPTQGHHMKPLRVFLIILLIILIGWGLFALLNKQPVAPVEEEKDYTSEVAEQGQIIAGFPQELLPEEGVTIGTSAKLTYTNRNEQLPTVEYVSAKTLEENIALFKNLLTTQGWTIVKEATPTENPVTNFYATKDGNDVNITLSSGATGVKVHIAYVARQ
ncbi:MAG: hypothetical protein NUW02_00820 [Candidatus Campbellbacteria bacterium]|nr:hypothetical protein [Candidatus Campbellbacteria bacterium]